MKLCNKEGCDNFSIPRGKYCNVHRTVKRKQTNTSDNIIEDRLLIEEQNREYLETLEADLKKIQEKKDEKIMFENNLLKIKKNVEKIDGDKKYFSVKVVFTEKNGFFYIFELHKHATTKDLYDLIDFFIYENKIDYSNDFSFIYYPNIEINRNDIKSLETIFNNKTIQVKVKTKEN
jgi:hypothetical protein